MNFRNIIDNFKDYITPVQKGTAIAIKNDAARKIKGWQITGRVVSLSQDEMGKTLYLIKFDGDTVLEFYYRDEFYRV